MKRYTLGFLFSPDLKKVLLIHKKHPEWQVGKVNGIGGKFEGNETSEACIVREMQEEAGLITRKNDWITVGSLNSSFFETIVLTTIYNDPLTDVQMLTDEEVEWVNCDQLPANIMANLAWLIPLCMDRIKHPALQPVHVTYTD